MAEEFDYSEFIKNFKNLIGNESQKDVAKKIGVSTSSLSKILKGQQKPNLDTMIQISKVYDCSIDSLLGITRNWDYTFADFLRMMDYLVRTSSVLIAKAEFTNHIADEKGTRQEKITQNTFLMRSKKLESLITDYNDAERIAVQKDGEMYQKLFDTWFYTQLKDGNKKIADDNSIVGLEFPEP